MTKERFYVYVIRDPRSGKNQAPIYVGKGTGNRATAHLTRAKNPRLARIIAKCQKIGLNMIIRKVKHFESEADAYAYEIKLIARYGRLDLKTGTLCNITAGGDGIDSETMRRIGADPKFRATMKAVSQRRSENMEYRAKLKAGCQRRSARLEYITNLTEANRRSRARPEVLAKLRAEAKRKAADPEFIAKMTEFNRNKADDPEFLIRQKNGCLQSWANNSKRRANIAIILKNSPAVKASRANPAYRELQSQKAKEAWARKRAEASVLAIPAE